MSGNDFLMKLRHLSCNCMSGIVYKHTLHVMSSPHLVTETVVAMKSVGQNI